MDLLLILIFFMLVLPLIFHYTHKSDMKEKDKIISELKNQLRPYQEESQRITASQIAELEAKQKEVDERIAIANRKYYELDRLRYELDDRASLLQKKELDQIAERRKLYQLSSSLKAKEDELADAISYCKEVDKRKAIIYSNISSLPYFSRIIADFDTRGLDILIQQLDWGDNQERKKKVKSIQEIKQDAAALIASYKEAEYQLAYAIQMFPALEDFLASEFSPDLAPASLDMLTESHDSVRNFLTKEEYQQLSVTERNQLALDRYWESHRRSRWQVGRDYEQYIGYRYSRKGYQIHYYGIEHGLEDLGRDIIALKPDQTLIIQCKYWSSKKQIHEKHINQLYGTVAEYCFESNLDPSFVRGVLVTNTNLSDTAKRFAEYLGIEVVENFQLGQYPCIKCNINQTDHSRIYHLPFDQQYDSCKISEPGEFLR